MKYFPPVPCSISKPHFVIPKREGTKDFEILHPAVGSCLKEVSREIEEKLKKGACPLSAFTCNGGKM